MALPPDRRDRLALAMVLVLLLILALLLTGVWEPVKGAGPPPLVATTQNVKVTLRAPAARHDIARAAAGADVVLLQEMNARRASRFTPVGFHSWQGPRGARAEQPVMWRASSLHLVAARTVLLHRSDLFQSATRYATVARFEVRRSGNCLRVINLHMVPGIDRAGHLVHAPRAVLARRAVAVIAGLARGAPACATITGGDWNFGYWHDCRVRLPSMPCARMHAVGYRAQWPALRGDRPTFGRRYIDTLWGRRITMVWQQVRGHTYSDHQQVRLGFYDRGSHG